MNSVTGFRDFFDRLNRGLTSLGESAPRKPFSATVIEIVETAVGVFGRLLLAVETDRRVDYTGSRDRDSSRPKDDQRP